MRKRNLAVAAALMVTIGGAAGAHVIKGAAAGATSAAADYRTVQAGTYVIDGTHTAAIARVSHLGFSTTTVAIDKIEGEVAFDPARPDQVKLDVRLAADSLSSGYALRDTHLKGANWFDVANHPELRFVADKLVKTGEDTVNIVGALTMRGVSRPVTLEAKLNKVGQNMAKRPTVGISAIAAIKRSDFGMTASLPGVGDEVELLIDVEANLK